MHTAYCIYTTRCIASQLQIVDINTNDVWDQTCEFGSETGPGSDHSGTQCWREWSRRNPPPHQTWFAWAASWGWGCSVQSWNQADPEDKFNPDDCISMKVLFSFCSRTRECVDWGDFRFPSIQNEKILNVGEALTNNAMQKKMVAFIDNFWLTEKEVGLFRLWSTYRGGWDVGAIKNM